MVALEEKNRRVLGDLECQRHNAEAARQATENKWREKEKEHKAELSHQTDIVCGIQRLLDEKERNHQQELNKVRMKTLLAHKLLPDPSAHVFVKHTKLQLSIL